MFCARGLVSTSAIWVVRLFPLVSACYLLLFVRRIFSDIQKYWWETQLLDPLMGGTSTPTTTHTKSVHANDRDPCSPMSSASPLPMTLPSPSLQPFTIEGGTSTTQGGDSMILSATVASFFHRGSVHDESTVLVVFVGATALQPPIHRSLIADADIGLGPLTYHPRPLKWGFIVWDLLFGF